MHYVALFVAATAALLGANAAQAPQHWKDLVKQYQDNTLKQLPQGNCTKKNIVTRPEWGDLSDKQHRKYIEAVKCLHKKPSIIGADKAPGARSRYDDFQAAHIINTPLIHATGSFFAWHRWFLYLWDKALDEECGYSGSQPYWDWSKYVDLPFKSNPLIDGSETSISSNGRYIPGRNGTLQTLPVPDSSSIPGIFTPPGTGGGYIYEGPFVNWTQHLGPYYNQTVTNGIKVKPNPGPNALGYNPRPIIRDFNNTLLLQLNTYDAVVQLIENNTSIHGFQPSFFGGAHLEAHSFISGVDNDLFTSPGDPLFWFHHAQVDRIWAIWQSADYATREAELDGTITLTNGK
ncbi:uncharacterized protein KY384_007259 [Bacidia gigantensis]|uniref:uncharacterized protein n=1 Tax=Bacidia gigantensis TaxID=2732470 RepID=UPI001D05BCDF|nr:uncharacterized protein KY384_007259 [Bacidia gigantensis]KAG8528341.1 hypothetical protein KY384_007259 [Bacidia gigantensis]